MNFLYNNNGFNEDGWILFDRAYDAINIFALDGESVYSAIVEACSQAERGKPVVISGPLGDFIVSTYEDMKNRDFALDEVSEIITHAASVATFNKEYKDEDV